jgi:Tol biopolymer transport system component
MRRDLPWLGWNPVEIWLGDSLFDQQGRVRVELGWQPGAVRNCSYASQPDWIGITAEDRTNGGQVLAIHERQSVATRVLLRQRLILHHALNRSGSLLCYTQPSAQSGAADLYLYRLEEAQPQRLAEGVVAQGSVLAWFPDDIHIAYHSPAGQIEILDSVQNQREALAQGQAPAVSPDGARIAFRGDSTIFIWYGQDRRMQHIETRRWLGKLHLADGLSWSADGQCLTFGAIAGWVGKQTDFYLLEVESERYQKTTLQYLSGLLLR